MKFLPQRRWKKVLVVAFLVLLIAGSIGYGYIRVSINKDVASPISVLNEDATEKALVVYQVGLSSAPKDASYAFAQGLASSGLRVEIATASVQAPSDLSNYKLLVLVFPIYGARPGEAAMRYVERLGNMNQMPTIIINCRLSNAIENVMKEKITAQNGSVIETLLAGSVNLTQRASRLNLSSGGM